MKHTVRAWLILLLLISGLLSACDTPVEPVTVDLSRRMPLEQLPHSVQNHPVLKVGLGSMMTPKEGYGYYRRLLDYLESRLALPIQVVDRESYEGFNKLLQNGDIDVAFVCSGPYIEGHAAFDLELLVVPESSAGETVYYSNLIVPGDSPARVLEDLRGKRFALVDPQSNSGRLVPEYLLAQRGETSASFFNETFYTYAHDKSVHLVAEGLVDGAAVDSLIYDYLLQHDPAMVANTRILMRSEPYGSPPVVVRSGLDPALRERLRKLLLTMHENPSGQKILGEMMVKRFVLADDRNYDSVRDLRAALQSQTCGNQP